MLSITGMPDLDGENSQGSAAACFREGTPLLLPKRGQPESSDVPRFPSGTSSILGKMVIIINRTNKWRMSRVSEQADVCWEGCEGAHIGLSQIQPHRHHLSQHPTTNSDPTLSQQQAGSQRGKDQAFEWQMHGTSPTKSVSIYLTFTNTQQAI